jgi:hypothetical protein
MIKKIPIIHNFITGEFGYDDNELMGEQLKQFLRENNVRVSNVLKWKISYDIDSNTFSLMILEKINNTDPIFDVRIRNLVMSSDQVFI